MCVGTLDVHLNGKKYIQWKTYRSRKKYSAYCALCQLGALDEYLNGKKHNRKMKIFLGHGGSDSTVIKRRQQQLGRMADILPSVTFSVFDL